MSFDVQVEDAGIHREELRWSALLAVDWTPRSYEIVALTFAGIVTVLLRGTPLPLSGALASYLASRSTQLLLAVYALALFVLVARLALHGVRHGRASLTDRETLVRLLLPHFSLDFLVRSVRRSIALLLTVFFFLHLKHVILLVHPANYDRLFWDLDRWMHFGVQPNIWMLERFGGNHDFALLIDWLYVKYFDYKILVSCLFLFEIRGRRLSDRFFLAYTLLWSVGGLSYLAMPADGPCYALLLERSVRPDLHSHAFHFPIVPNVPETFGEAYSAAKIWNAKYLQQVLWTERWSFLSGARLPGLFYGIAAMPSLHVAAVVMFMVFLFKLSTLAGIIALAYAAAITIGSVFLQWHYAIDGYAGAAMAAAVCWIALRSRAVRVRLG